MDRFAICQAYAQLESDYNVGGILRERPSNRRRNESIGVQLSRIGYSNPYGWVDIEAEASEEDDCYAEDVRMIYMQAVLRWDLPISEELMDAMRAFFVADFLVQYQQTAGRDYKQGT